MAGSVTNQSGIITNFTDAVLTGRSVPDWQWQYPVTLTTLAGLCGRLQAGQGRQTGEAWLGITVLGYHVIPGTLTTDPSNTNPVPYPPLPATLTPHVGVELPTNSGNAYTVAGTYQGAKGSQQDASAGTVAYTAMSDTLAEATYSLTFRAGTMAGTFTAPYCER